MRRIAILTGGGDCPGLNPVIRGVVRKALKEGYEVIGFTGGWDGAVNKKYCILDRDVVSGILHTGGTILKTSRTNPYKEPENVKKIIDNCSDLNVDALIAIGGDDTLGVANKLWLEEKLPTVAIPKTIDNDLMGTDRTFGFDTAINIVMDAIDRLHTTAASHNRVMVVEVMGRHAGWIALEAGVAGGADFILVPEFEVDIDEVCKVIKKRAEEGRNFSIIVAAEGASIGHNEEYILKNQELDDFGHVQLGGIGDKLANLIEKKTGFETRSTVLGHIQRGGSPTAFDRVLGTRFGVKAVELVLNKDFGKMVSLKGTEIVAIDINDAVSKTKLVNKELFDVAEIFFN